MHDERQRSSLQPATALGEITARQSLLHFTTLLTSYRVPSGLQSAVLRREVAKFPFGSSNSRLPIAGNKVNPRW